MIIQWNALSYVSWGDHIVTEIAAQLGAGDERRTDSRRIEHLRFVHHTMSHDKVGVETERTVDAYLEGLFQ